MDNDSDVVHAQMLNSSGDGDETLILIIYEMM